MKRFREIPKEEKGGKKNVSTPKKPKILFLFFLFILLFKRNKADKMSSLFDLRRITNF
jgi:hypothetical protein